MTPRITIAMPVRNVGPWVEESIASILAQTFTDWELWVLDDGSTDDTADRFRRFRDPRIHFVADGLHLGLPARLNQVIDRARTDLFARMDGDDVAYPERLQTELEYLENHPACDVVAAHQLVIDAAGAVSGVQKWRGETHEDITASPWAGFHMNHPTWLGRTDWFRRYRYREDADRNEDEDLLMRSYRESRFARLPVILNAYRGGIFRLGPTLRTRRSNVSSIVRVVARGGDPRLLLGVPLHLTKAGVDVLAAASGLGVKLLRHRAAEVDRTEVARWETVRAQVGDVLEKVREGHE